MEQDQRFVIRLIKHAWPVSGNLETISDSPPSGCMALTTFFYLMLSYGSVPEKNAAVGADEDIFIQICARIGLALVRHYRMSAEQVAFFTVHEEIGQRVMPIDAFLLARYLTSEDRQRITRAMRLSHEFELLFDETV